MVDMVTKAETHGLIVSPTGSGKSLAMFFPVVHEYLNGQDGITLVILPFVALEASLSQHAKHIFKKLGITYGIWPNDFKGSNGVDYNSVRLIFMQVDAVINNDATELLRQLKLQRRVPSSGAKR